MRGILLDDTMIFDSLNHFNTYLAVSPLFSIVSEFINSHDLSMLPLGKCDISRGVYLNKNEYVTRDIQSKFIECHRQYIDIHIIDEGKENIGFCNRADCTIIEKYNEEKDLEKLNGKCSFITLKKGYFGIFFPQDAHMPGVNVDDQKQTVKKVVFKIPI
jgi:YhcH/YjgK/YiaL family protein